MPTKPHLKTKLPKAFKNRWVAALRSGKYKQANNELKRRTYDAEGKDTGIGFCCLGVAVEMNGGDTQGACVIFPNVANTCSSPIPKALISPKGGDSELANQLAKMNDGYTKRLSDGTPVHVKPRSFKQIAAYIDRYL